MTLTWCKKGKKVFGVEPVMNLKLNNPTFEWNSSLGYD